ncbi:MAG: Mur ligase family protein [Planctomycetes bacterium]|nr:Mur ligase family protein [Planctomycetota bacterium]
MNAPLAQPSALPPAARAALLRYEAARRYIDVELVRPGKRRHDPAGKVAAALAFNRALGDPQRAWPSVQVAGTSGKGSVATMIAAGLSAAGLRTGLHVSPYLQAFTEKVVVDGVLADAGAFARAVDAVRPAADALRARDDLPASVHGLAALGATYLCFREAGVEAAVIETGVGGRFDLVQGLDRALTVITDLGLDHMDVLGETLDEIAWHKAGVMAPGVPCVAVEGPGWGVLAAEAARVGAPLVPVRPGGDLRLPRLGPVALPASPAPWQARNAAVAAAALDALAGRGWPIGPEHVARALASRPCPGRFEVVQAGDPRVVLDGAHNQPKLEALRRALAADPGAVIVFATTGGRDPRPLLEAIGPAARSLVCTAPVLHGKDTAPPGDLARAARALGLDARAVDDPLAALDEAIAQARREGRTVVVTGSLYLVGQARERWVPWERVVLGRTPWPEARLR